MKKFGSYSIKNNFLKAIYKVLLAYLIVCWIFLGVVFAENFIKRHYFFPLQYKETVCKYADYYGLNRALVFAIIKTESSFDNKALSSKGAKGLMQITDKTGEYIAQKLGVKNYDLFNHKTNINFGCFYLKYLYNKFQNIDTAIVAYNAGEGNVALWLMDSSLTNDGKTLSIIPFKESDKYLKRVKENFANYVKLYKNILDKQ